MDEVNFHPGAKENYQQSKIMKTYHAIKVRMQSRFLRNGILSAKLFLVSSKRSDQDFIESYIEEVKNDPEVYVVDEPQWNIKPPETYSGKRFYVAVGNKTLKSRICQDGENIESLKKQGYDVLHVPIEYKRDFEKDLERALMDLAGVSSTLVSKFISYESLERTYSTDKNPFQHPIISIGTRDNLEIRDFFIPELVNKGIPSKPIYIHIDGSLTGDMTGISAVAIMGVRNTTMYSSEEGTEVPIRELVYKHVFTIGIHCPAGAEISLSKNRKFIYYLRDLGWNIKGVSFDGFQSADSKQQLLQAGYNASIISLDRTPDGYMYLKASINEKRISILQIPELETELINLEQNNMSGKVDHNVHNTKDLSDSLCGALFNASKFSDLFSLSVVDNFGTMMSINEERDISADYKESLTKAIMAAELNRPYLDADELADKREEKMLDPRFRQKVAQDLKSRLTPQEKSMVTDEELLSAFTYGSGGDDSILLF